MLVSSCVLHTKECRVSEWSEGHFFLSRGCCCVLASMSSQKRTLARRSLTGEPDQQLVVAQAQAAIPPGVQTSRRASAAHLRKKLNASSVDEELGSCSGEDEGGEDFRAPDGAVNTTAGAVAAAAASGHQPLSAVTSTTAAAAEDSATALSGDQELAPSVRRMSLDDNKKEIAAEMAMAAAAAAAGSAQAAAAAGASSSRSSSSPSDGPKPSRAERRSSIDASIMALAAQQAGGAGTASASRQVSAPESFNLVWQKRSDGSGWSMGSQTSTATPGTCEGVAASAAPARTGVKAIQSGQRVPEKQATLPPPLVAPPPPPLAAPSIPVAPSMPPPLVPPTASTCTSASASAPPYPTGILAAETLPPGAPPPSVARIPRRRVTVVRRGEGVVPQLLVHGDATTSAATPTPFLPIDTTGDGLADALVADTDFDGRADALVLDTSGDGVPDTAVPCVLVDTDGDGLGDILLVDTTDDGHADTIIRIFSAQRSNSGASAAARGQPQAPSAPAAPLTVSMESRGSMPSSMLPHASTPAPCPGTSPGPSMGSGGTFPSTMPSEQGSSNPPMVSGLDDVDVFSILDATDVYTAKGGATSAPTAPACPVAAVANIVHPAIMHPAPHGCAMTSACGSQDWDPASSGPPACAAARPVKGSKADGTLQKQGWTPEEDATIVRMVQLTGQKWSFIACALPGRTDDAVRNRYLRLQKKTSSSQCVTNADLADCQATKKGDMWTAEEDARIMEGVRLHGYKWQQIASVLPGRSANAVRNRFLRCSPEQAAGAAAGPAGMKLGTSSAAPTQYGIGFGEHGGMPTLPITTMHGVPVQSLPPQSLPMPAMGMPGPMPGMPMPQQMVHTSMGTMGGGGHIGDELMVPPGGGQGVNFFWDASALYGEALGAIHDDLFAAVGDERGS